MSAAIGKAALVLSVNQQGLRSGLAGSTADVNRWADGVGRGLSSRMGNAGKAAGGGLLSGLAGSARGTVGPLLAAYTGIQGVSTALDTLFETARSGAAAKAFGLTAEQFTGIQGLARTTGEQSREFIESLVTLTKLSDEGARGVGTVAPEWFRQLNIDAREFNALRLDEKFFKVFEAIAAAGPNVDKVRAVMAPFGEDGGKFLFTLTGKAPEELRRMAASFAISADEVARATRAHEAYTRAQTTMSAGWRTAVVAVAPLFEKIAGGVERAQPLFNWLGRAFGTVAQIGGAALEEVGNLVTWVTTSVGGWLTELLGVGATVPTIEQVVTTHFRTMGTVGALVWDTLKSGAGVVAVAFGAIIEHTGGVIGAFRGLVEMAARLPDKLKPAGFDGFAAGVAAADDRVRRVGRGMREWGQGAVTSWGQSATQFNSWLDRVSQRQQEATARTAAAAAGGANQVAAAVSKLDNAALLKGSSAEVSVRLKHEFGSNSPEQRTLEAIRDGNGILGDIRRGIDRFTGISSALLPM